VPEQVFDLTQTHGMLRQHGARVYCASDMKGWTSAYVSVQRERPFEGQFDAVEDQLIVLHRSGPARIETFREDRARRRTVPVGGIHLYPGGESFRIGLFDPLDTIHIYVRRALIERVAQEIIVGDPALIYVPPRIIAGDRTMRSFATLFEHALEHSDNAQAIYADQLAIGVACYLVRYYSTATLRPRGVSVIGFGAEQICALAIEYMTENLSEKLTLDGVVAAVGRSASFINAAFRECHGVSTHQYLMKMRLRRARELIAGTSARITDIALDCGFASQEHLARYFKREFGITPRQARTLDL